MGYSGVVSSEALERAADAPGAITKTGNAHLRRIVVEAAWAIGTRPPWADLAATQNGPRGQGDRLESPTSSASPVRAAGRGKSPTGGHRGGTRAAGLHLGHRRAVEARPCRALKPPEVTIDYEGSARGAKERGTRKGESSISLRQALRPTRDTSPRQLPTNHDHAARSTNIRVINRRATPSRLPSRPRVRRSP